MEPLVQGASGMRMCRESFVKDVAARLRAAGVLLIFDEVMTGFGRTGSLFACTKTDVVPDIICLSKGLTGGFLPMSVTVCRDALFDAFLGEDFSKALAHGHSFTANPLGCAAALASLQILLDGQTQARIKTIETYHRGRLKKLADRPQFLHSRVTGTIAALDVAGEEAGYTAAIGVKLRDFFIERGLLIRPLGNVIYLLPPYCVTDDQLGQAYDAILCAAEEIL